MLSINIHTYSIKLDNQIYINSLCSQIILLISTRLSQLFPRPVPFSSWHAIDAALKARHFVVKDVQDSQELNIAVPQSRLAPVEKYALILVCHGEQTLPLFTNSTKG
jgi:hypothetical protein